MTIIIGIHTYIATYYRNGPSLSLKFAPTDSTWYALYDRLFSKLDLLFKNSEARITAT